MRFRIAAAVVVAVMSAAAAAQTITGTVTNGTNGKPSAHDDVVLLDLMQGMNEAARTTTDAQGRFSLKAEGLAQGPHLVRVNHEGVNYFSPAPPGTNIVEVKVYDASKKLESVSGTVNVIRLQTDAGSLQGVELYAVKNSSTPPRTLMNDRPFEFYLPAGAQIDQAAAQSPGGNPVNVSPVPEGGDGRYYVVFPIRPGETQFQIAYHLPYSGQATVHPKFTLPFEHLAVVLPKSMQFSAENGTFSPMNDNGTPVQVATNVTPDKQLAFRVSGTGVLQDDSADSSGGQQGQAAANGRVGPGGGLGTPIGTPDPLHQYRFVLLGTLAAVLAAGGIYIVTRPKPALAAAPAAQYPRSGPAAVVQDRSATLLEALKEELFQLEVDRQQGRLSPAEYAKAKDALDQTIQRALARRSA